MLVFPSAGLPVRRPLTGTLYSFAIFALAFIARPVGTVIFMAIDRRYGRGVKLTIALFLLGGSTVGDRLPARLRAARLRRDLCCWRCCRIGQGMALGGAWDGLPRCWR